MINKLLPEQISKLWDIIKYAVEQSLPPTTGRHADIMNRILASMLSGGLDVWAIYDRDNMKFEGILVTQFLYDEASATKNLLLYCLYGYSGISDSSWTEGFESMVKYAKANKCSNIVAYTSNKYIIEMARKYEGSTEFTFISFNLQTV